MTKQKKRRLSEPLLNALLEYLGSKPYVEVAQLIAAIQNEIRAEEGNHQQNP